MNLIVLTALISIFSGVLLPGLTVIIAVPLTSLIVLFFDRGAFSRLGGIRFWLLFISGTILLPLFGGGNSINLVFGLQYSLDLLFIGLRVVARGYLIFLGLMLIRRHVPLQNMSAFLMKLGFNRLAVLIPLAFHFIPVVMENTKNTFMIWLQRGGLRKNRIRNLLLLLTSFQVNWMREAESLSIALLLSSISKITPDNDKNPII